MVKILIVDDHKIVCDSLKEAFSGVSGFKVIETLSDSSLVDLYCEKLHPDLVLMDVCTEGGSSGLEATRKVLEGFPDTKVIVMTGFDEVTYCKRAREAGAQGFVYKTNSFDYFVDVAKKVMAGETCFPEPRTLPVASGESPLTKREMEILRLSCKNMTGKEIAAELGIEERTVKFHRQNMLAKTGKKNIHELIFYVITNGWINPNY